MNQLNYDSELCGSLPIHLTNLIQSHGILLIIEKQTHTIIQASENTQSVFRKPATQLVNTSLFEYIGQDQRDQMQKYIDDSRREKLPLSWVINGKQFLVLLHPKEKFYMAEIELQPFDATAQDSFVKVFQDVRFTISAIESAKSVQEACTITTHELKRLSGFDKIMIYSFDANFNGTVLSEEMEEGMESYLGFTFPASDIPKQARQLYQKNPYRLIPDRNYQPVKLYPVINPLVHSFIDLSDCNLRSVAAVHIEYLKNMGVTASMSTRILKDDQLWGLIACHHRTDKNLSYQVCSIFEMMSSILSAKIASLINKESHDFNAALQEKYTRLIEQSYKTSDVIESLLNVDHGIMHLFSATGAVVTRKGKAHFAGDVPAKVFLDDLILWLHTRQLRTNFYTDSLLDHYELAESFTYNGSGIFIIPINYLEDEYIMVFRPEVVRTIQWGGNPDDRIQFENDQRKYHPRSSFKAWQENVKGRSMPWKEEEINIGEKLRGFIFEQQFSSLVLRR
jgi:two-component system, chemotaxis family, sensor kinase Cph1